MPAAPVASKREQNRVFKAQHIAACALDCFAERGFHSTRIEDIAEAAGVAKGTFYLYYESKESVVLALMAEFTRELERILTWVGEDLFRGEQEPMQIFAKEAKELMSALYEKRVLARWLFKEGRSVSSEIDAEFQRMVQSVTQQSKANLIVAQNGGWIQCADPGLAATLIVGGIMQLYAEWLEERVDRPLNQVVFQVLFFYASMFGMDLSQLGGIPAGATTT
jgi:AcrR family transcriptional regulator